ncbi:hypothetical protein SOVF_166210 [Spinacia oleracea]|uniref:Heavy metal-associated isoprenylated plant protein 7 n=1 Tax=Spinacia oleracea TaxID=3562 RepID=A0A9R0IE57_SPIOL|nr:heavy metal-associated isoprenylated plant protein 7-like [Spinacia oleracea]KNA08047.1 hypothetical protein SOVF_166210 [Spinacia oleracea]
MGEAEDKKESNGGGGDGSTEENKEKDEPIVIKVDMHCHCEACAKKIFRSIRSYQGVEEVAVDRKTNMVVVKGKTAEPLKLCHRIRHKTGRNAQLLSPLPPKPAEEEKPKEDDNNKDIKDEPPQKDQPPPVVRVVLGVHMHCEACAQLLRKRIRKIKGVESVETDVGKGEVIVKGVIGDPEVLVKYVHKKTRKQVSIIKEDHVEQDKKQDATTTTSSSELENDKKEEKENKDDNNNDNTIIDENAKMMMMMTGEINSSNDYYWPSARIDYHHHHHNHDNNNLNYQPPQMFSDENPNACSIM